MRNFTSLETRNAELSASECVTMEKSINFTGLKRCFRVLGLVLFLGLLSPNSYGVSLFNYYTVPADIGAPTGTTTACVGMSNAAFTAVVTVCSNSFNVGGNTWTAEWVFDGAIVFTSPATASTAAGLTFTLPAGTFTYNTAGTFSGVAGLYLQVKWNNGTSPVVCGSLPPDFYYASTNYTTIVVNKLPVFTGVTETPNPGCVGSSMALAATTSSAGSGAIVYAWTSPGGTAITNPTSLTTASVNSLAAGNAGIYTITATVAGCVGTASMTSTSAMVVNQKPVFSGVTETPNPGCIGSSMVLAATTSTAGSGPIVYTWTGPGGTGITNPASLTLASVNPLAAGNAGVYTISATVPGCAGTASMTSTSAMVVNQKPVFSGVTETPNPGCIGSSMALAATTSTAGSGPIVYTWTGPGGTGITNPTSLTLASVNPLASGNAGIYTISATVAGCAGTATMTSTSAMVVNQLPTFTGVTETPNPGCIGSSILLAATTSAAGAGPIVYSWLSPGGTAITNPASLTTASVNPLAAGNAGVYTINATVAGCVGTASMTSTSAMVVNQLPTFTSATETPNPGCIGGSMVLAATTSTAGAGPIAYSWTSPGGTAITNPTSLTTASVNSLAAGNAGVYTISATVAGCVGTASMTSTSAMVVNQLPSFSGVTENPNPGCIGGSMVLAATVSSAGSGPIVYNWTSPGGTAITNPTSLTTASVNSLAAGNAGIYTISATVAGCAGTSSMPSTSPMVVNSAPTLVTASLSSTPLCVGNSLTLNGAATGADSYSWAGPTGGAAMTSTTTVSTEVSSVTALNAGVYTLTATNACGNTTAVTTSLDVNQLPVFTDVTETTNPACIGGSMTLAATISTAGLGPVVYSWAGPGGSDITNPNSLTTASVNPLSAGDAGAYTISATVAGCAGTNTAVSSVPLVLNSQPSSVAPATSPTTVCAGDLITLTGNVTDGTSLSYSWTGPVTGDISDPSSINTTINTATVSDAGSYSLTVTAAGCAPVTGVSLPQTVNKLPTTVTASVSATTACQGDNITLLGGDSGDGAGVNYSWTGPVTGDIIGALSETAIIASVVPGDAGVYTLTATAPACSGSTIGVSSALTVNVLPSLVTASVSPTPACVGSGISLFGGDSGDGIGVIYTWTGPVSGDILSAASENTGIAAASLEDEGAYTLTATAPGCSGASFGTTDFLLVNMLPTVVTADLLPNPACVGSDVTLFGGDSGDGVGVLYSWTGPGAADITSVSSETTDIASAALADAGSYTLTATAPGCSGNVFAATGVLSVNVLPTTVTASVSPTTACVGDNVTLTGGDSGDGVGVVYSWDGPVTGDIASVSSESTNIPSVAFADAGFYTLTASAPGRPGSTVVNTDVLTVNIPPDISDFSSPTVPSICVGASTDVTVNSESLGTATFTATYDLDGANTAVGHTAILTMGASSGTFTIPSSDLSGIGSTTVTITSIQNASGCNSAVLSNNTGTFTVSAAPAAAPSNDGYICMGGTVNLSANPSGGATVFAWSGPGLASTSGVTTTAMPAATATYSLTVSDGSGLSGCTSAIQYFTTVSVNPTPVAAPTNNGYICNGGTVILSANPGGGATSFTWSGDGLLSGSGVSTTATPTVTTTYTLTVSDGSTRSGCAPSTSYFTTVAVADAPTAAPSNNGYICNGGAVVLNANEGGSATTFSWVGPNITGSPASDITSAAPTATSTYTLTVSNGSTQPGCVLQLTTTVSVNPVPSALPANNGYICIGGIVTLTANEANGASTFAWTGANITGSTSADVTTATPTATTTYTLMVTDGSGHSGCSPLTQLTTTVSVNPTPVAAPGNNGYICNGGTVTLSAGASGGASAYSWAGPNLSSTTNANPTATPTGTSTYTLTVSDGTIQPGCFPNTQYYTTVSVNPTPAASPSGNGPICVGGTVNLLANPSGGATQFTWAGAALSSTSIANPTAAPSATSIYTLTVSDGSTQPGCQPSIPYFITVSVNAVPTLVNATNNSAICAGSTLDLTANGAANVTSYSWTGPVAITNAASANASVPGATTSASGQYTVVVSNGSGSACTASYTTIATVNPLPAAFNVTGGGSFCASDTGVHVGLDGSESGISYQLYNGSTGLGIKAGTGSALDFGLQTTNGTYTVLATNTSTLCNVGMTGGVTVTVNALPDIFSVMESDTAYCFGTGGITVSLSGSDTGVSYQLYLGASPTGSAVIGLGSAFNFGSEVAPGTYFATGTNIHTGCHSAMADSARVIVDSLPHVYNVIGGGPYCAGTTGVDNSLSGSDTGVSYRMFVGLGSTVTLGTGSPLDLGLDTTEGTITVFAINNITACAIPMSGTPVVTMNPAPAVGSVSGGGTYCEGTGGVDIQLSSSETAAVYKLYNGATLITSAPGTGGVLDFGLQTAAGTYTVTASYTVTGCSSIMADSAVIIMNPAPAVYSVTGTSSYCSVDAGVAIGLSGSDTGITYTLYNAGASVASMIGVPGAFSFGTFPAGTYTVGASNNITGCLRNMSGTLAVTMNLTPAIGHVSGGGSYCATGDGEHIFLDVSENGVNYTLYNDGVFVGVFPGTGSTPLDFGLLAAGGTYTVSAANASSGCSSNMADSAVITVIAMVTPSVTVATGIGDTSCSGSAVTFTATGVNGGGAPVYSWSVNTTAIAGATASTYNYTPASGDIVEVTMISSAACAVPDTVSASDTMTVLEHATPGVTISVDPGTTVCAGTVVAFTATPAFGGASPTYVWSVNGAVVVGSGASYAYTPATGDSVGVEVISNYPCLTIDTAISSVIMHVGVSVAPIVNITAAPGLTINTGDVDTLTAHLVIGGPVTYQWMLDHSPIAGATDSVYIHTFNNGDSLTCVVTGTNGCNLSDSETVGITVNNLGVTAVVIGDANLRLVPNPNKGEFFINGLLGSANDAEVTLEVTDMLGQVIYNSNVTVHNGVMNQKVNLGNTLANGMYIMNVSMGDKRYVFHFMVAQ